LWSHTDRTRAFLRYRGVVDYQYGIAAADELIRLDQKFCFQRLSIPDSGRDEVVQLIVVATCKPLSHRLNALTLAGTDQS
jgi:hypothetical protein